MRGEKKKKQNPPLLWGGSAELHNICRHQILLMWIIAVPSPLEESSVSLFFFVGSSR